MLSERDYAERRDFIRMFIDATVAFRRAGDAEWSQGQSRNLSGSGVLFNSPVPLAAEQLVEFRLGSAQSKVSPLEGELRVVRATANDDGSFEVAAEIVKLT